jgi:hypothetical protein
MIFSILRVPKGNVPLFPLIKHPPKQNTSELPED